jgi:hypothetical protein
VAKREESDLKKEDGWLTLAGLFWLKDGVNTVGAGPQFDVQLTITSKRERSEKSTSRTAWRR